MSKFTKWSLPVLAFAVVVALMGVRADAQADAAKGKVSGIIHNEDGTPAANVTVRLVASQGKGNKAKPQAADDAKPGKKRPEAVATATTDAEGKFELEAPAGKYNVMANLRGQGSARKAVEIKAGETAEVGTLTLKKPSPKKEAAPTT